ncbi:MAG: gliding motility-associated C-terminal domain-containing protein [Flavobacteriales bacterium]|nr:gliding motility-associated C-terminal domain-containing protein [Flavobacteriales bacterium]
MTVTGGVSPYDFSWSGPDGFTASSESIANLPPGDYTLDILDDNSCVASETFSIIENPEIISTITVVDNLCGEGENGEISVSLTGGAPPFDFEWTGPDGFTSTDQNLTNLESGLYEVTITDAANCVITEQATVNEPTDILIDFTTVDLLCNGDGTGEATATASGGTPGYNYSWTGPDGFSANGPGITGLHAGVYAVTVLDDNSCSETDSVEVFEPPVLEVNLTETPITCSGGDDGAISTVATGGTAGYTYSWTGPDGFTSTDENISNLEAGIYEVEVTDANGCVVTEQLELPNPGSISVTGTVVDGTCNTSNNGEISIEITGGTPEYSFNWTGPGSFSSTQQNISGLANGTYSVTVSDENGCSAVASFEVTSPDALSASFVRTNILCFGDATGSIETTISGGTPPYTYLWIGPSGFISTDEDLVDVSAGSYSLQVIDANSCAGFFSVNLTQPPQITITGPITNATCFGFADGSINAIVNGGVPPRTFSWSGPDGFSSTQEDITGLAAGTYTLTVTDANGCERSRDYNVQESDEIVIDETIQDVLCVGQSDGSIELSISGGEPPFSANWTGSDGFTSTDQDIFNLQSGSYTVEITDDQNCTAAATYSVGETFVIAVDADITDVSCFGDGDGSIDAAVSGGTEPYTISWTGSDGFTSSDANLINLIAGDYAIAVEDANGCEFNSTFTVGTPDELIADVLSTDVICNGNDDGEATVNPNGGNPPYTVAWTGPDGFTSTDLSISNLIPGIYEVTVTDNLNCTAQESIEVFEPEEIVVSIDETQPNCLVDDGVLTASATGGTVATDYDYSWLNSGGSQIGTSPTLTGLAPGEYTIVITDDNGCSQQLTVELTRVTFNLSASLQNISCFGETDGAISLTPSSGTPPFDYAWSGPNGFSDTGSSISNLEEGNYQVTVTDDAGCVLTTQYAISEPDTISFEALITDESCPGVGDGSISLTMLGGTPGFTVAWTGPDGYSEVGLTIADLNPGDYTATATDINGCVGDTTLTVGVGSDFDIDFTATAPLCADSASGLVEVILTPTAGNPEPFSFEWSGSDGFTSTHQDIQDLAEGTYVLIVTDNNGCSKTDSVSIVDPDPLVISTTVQNANCAQADGEASASVTGGTAVYTFTWTNESGDTLSDTSDLLNVESGIYTITVSDENGCEVSELVSISDQNGSINGTLVNPTCSGGVDGEISIEVVDGEPPYTYSWTDGSGEISTAQNLDGVGAGVYAVLVEDDNGCIYSGNFELIDPLEILGNPSVTPVSCAGDDGAIALNIENGTPPYSVSWTGPDGFTASGESISNLAEGTYTYQITDANTCEITADVEVNFAADIAVVADITDVLCGGDESGSIELEVSGGTPPYDFEWVSGGSVISTSQNIANLSGGIYELTVSDVNGCSISESYEVEENDLIEAEFTVTQPDCNEENGSIVTSLSGGVVAGNYFFAWTDGNGDPLPSQLILNNIGVGTYNLSVTDDLGCTLDTSIVVSNPGGDITVTQTDISCAGAADGSIELEISDVAEPYAVAWTGPNGFTSLDEEIFGLEGGIYNYLITGDDGCSYFGEVNLNEPDAIVATSSFINTCFGENTGDISTVLEGGVLPYVISWTGPNGFTSSDLLLTDLEPGTYVLTVQDENGCEITESYEVVENPELTADASITEINCFGENSGAIDLTVNGGEAPFEIEWSDPDGFISDEASISNLNPGTYDLNITDAANCSFQSTYTLVEPDSLEATFTIVSPGCSAPGSLGEIEVVPNGGTPNYTIAWTGPDGFVSTDFALTDLEAGMYSYTLSDANGCEISDSIEIETVVPIEVTAELSDVSCNGDTDGSISVTVSGGLPDYTYSWIGPDGFTSDSDAIEDLIPGEYTLSITDEAGCSLVEVFEVANPEILEATATATTDALCSNSADGTATLEINGGTPPYEVNWTGPDGYSSSEQSPVDLAPGDYQVVIADAGNCTVELTVTIDFVIEVVADAGDDLLICSSDLPFLYSANQGVDFDVLWFNLDGDTLSTIDSLLLESLAPGEHQFIIEASFGQCASQDTLNVEILSNPEADAGPDLEVFAEEFFELGGNPTSATATSYAWTPNPTLSLDTTLANPSGFLMETQLFTVFVTDANGCVGLDTVLVEVLPEVQITSGFTPNGDGVNDLWIIDNMELFPNNVVHIFNRWGTSMYKAKSYNMSNAWDGTYEGEPVPVGTYYYAIELNDPRFPDPITGPITINR